MKKHIIFFLFITNVCIAQTKWDGRINSFIRIEIENESKSINLLKEGLLCKYWDENGKSYVDFFPIKKLDIKHLTAVQNYLLNCSLLLKDTTIDEPYLMTTGYVFSFFIIKNHHSNYLFWEDGECEELKTCISLINELIPKRKRTLYKITPNP